MPMVGKMEFPYTAAGKMAAKKAAKKTGKSVVKRPNAKPVPLAPAPKAPKRGTATPVPLAPAPKKTKGRITPMPKTKKKVTVMPDKISPSKMTPAQKARYLKNPERYDK